MLVTSSPQTQWQTSSPPQTPPYRKAPNVAFRSAVPPQTVQQAPPKNDDYSVWRDTALRYGGYADEVGEFLTPYLGGLGKFVGYGLSTLYCLGDMGTTLPQKFAKGTENGLPADKKLLKTGGEGLDLAAFHAVATLWIPPMLIGSVVDSANKLLDRTAHVEEPGDVIRKGIMSVADKMVLPVKEATNTFVDTQWVNAWKPVVEEHLKAPADQFIRTYNKPLAKVAGVFVAISNMVANTPGLKKFWSVGDASSLSQNVDNLAQQTAFKVDDLTRLLFVKPLPVMIGIGMVPLIAHPFDQLMLKVQDWTIRPLLGKNKIVRNPDGSLSSVRNPNYWGPTKQPASGSVPVAHIPNSRYWMVLDGNRKMPATLQRHHHFASVTFPSNQPTSPTYQAPGMLDPDSLKVRQAHARPQAPSVEGQAFII